MNRSRRAGGFAVVLVVAAGCSRANEVEAARNKSEVEALRAELARLQAQHNELRADVELLRLAAAGRAAGLAPTPKAGDRPRISFSVRLDAIQNLTDTTERQRSYYVLALDAATAGDVELNKKCIANLIDTTQRQDAIYKSALRLAAANRADEALVLTKQLIDTTTRQRALAKIAQGEFKE